MTQEESSTEFYRQIFCSAWITQAIAVAAELGIADTLRGGPHTAEDLARRVGANSQALYRLLRALASVGIFTEDSQRRFSLTARATLLRSDVPESQRAIAIMMGGEFHQTWGELLHSVRTGLNGFLRRFGKPFFQYMATHPERHRIYDAAMNSVHGTETACMVDAYDFSGLGVIADIGGGNGQTLIELLHRHNRLRGLLFELPPVAEHARSLVAQAGMADRCTVVGGDFFRSVPAGADAYLLRHILHDWEDVDAVQILRRCRQAMGPHSKVLIVESLIPNGNQPGVAKWLDLMMLLVGGRERDLDGYQRLLAEARLQLTRVVSTAAPVSIMECAAR